MENNENEEVVYKISPHFNLFYELFLPTGRKIKSAFLLCILMLIITAIVFCNYDNITIGENVLFGNVTIFSALTTFLIVINVLFVLKLLFHIIFQTLQYKHITYTFYNTHMVYEDDFLNQHRKNIKYINIREVEIRRTIIDRLLGYGVIIIYTNAENNKNNGMVIYALRNPKAAYDKIEKIVHRNENRQNDYTMVNYETSSEKSEKSLEQNGVKSENKAEYENAEAQTDLSEKKLEEEEILAENIRINEEYSSDEERLKRIAENNKEEEAFLESLKNVNDVENVENSNN